MDGFGVRIIRIAGFRESLISSVLPPFYGALFFFFPKVN